jgi:predicted enzyme related to lactoylglutathione lyase
MVTRDTAWPTGTPCWVDLAVDDVKKAISFYGALFGWEADVNEDPQYGGHGNFKKDGRDVGGVGQKPDPSQPSAWFTYIASDDAARTAEKVRAAGGQVIMDVMAVGPFGTMILAADPGGAIFGVWQAGENKGMQLANEPGSVTWNENLSRDYATNRKFYGDVFGYEFGDMSGDGFVYATLDLSGGPVGGIGELPTADMPANWTTYFAVSDTDATVAKAVELGATVLREAFDTPQGRVAILSDDQGAMFAIINV